MPKSRIHEVAKKLNVSNKELMQKLEEMGVSATNHMQSIEDDVASRVSKAFHKKTDTPVGAIHESPAKSASQSAESPATEGRPVRPESVGAIHESPAYYHQLHFMGLIFIYTRCLVTRFFAACFFYNIYSSFITPPDGILC